MSRITGKDKAGLYIASKEGSRRRDKVKNIMSTSPRPKSPKNYGTIENYDTESNISDDTSPHGTDYQEQALAHPHHEPSYDRARRRSFIEEDEDPLQIEPPTMKKKDENVTWSSLPHKSQLAILTIARLSEPLVQTSLRVGHLSLST